VRGFRIELGEVEAVLAQHPGLLQSVVVISEGATGDRQLVAYLVPRESSAPSSNELRKHLQEKLPDYMLPSHFSVLEALPLTPSGKVDRRALSILGVTRSEQSESTLVLSPIEEIMVELWKEILGLRSVGIHENFFELGGHSLLATQLITRVQAVLQVDVPLRSVFEAPTVAELAERVEVALRAGQKVEMPPLVLMVREGELPLSFAQQRLWFVDQLEPNSTAYTIANAVRLSGRLDAAVLEQSLGEIVRRHESLRTTFQIREGQPVQVIALARPFRLPMAELNGLPLERRETEAQQLAQQETRQPFDLAHSPLLRATLLRLSEDEHILLLSMHHIISDAWSMRVFVRELSTLYNAFVQGQPSPIPELTLQYADFAAWQRQWLQGEVLEAQVRYWTQQLGEAAPLELPTDYPRPATQTFRGARQSLWLPTLLSEGLKRLSQCEGVTLFMTLLAAFQVLLSQYSGQSDISVGTPIANRTRAELEGLIGFFVNTLVLRGDLSGNPSFRELLKRVREVCLGAYAHQDVPFEKLVEVLQPERDLSRPPLFQAAFQLQHALIPQRLYGLTTSSLPNESRTAKFELSLTMTESEQGLHCGVEYNTDLFEASTISRLLGHWQTLLAGIVAHPEQRLAELPLLSESERQQLLVDWNETQTDEPGEVCLHTLFEAQVERTPEAVALVFEDAQVTYREMNERANQVARHLQQQGVGPEVLVGLYLERSLEMVIGLLGVLKAGGAYVPLDPTYPRERLAFMLADAQVPILLTHQSALPTLPKHEAGVICLDSDWTTIAQQCKENPCSRVDVENAAYTIYTSGSTGRPKGVVVTHRGIGNLSHSQVRAFEVRAGSHVLQFASLSFDASLSEVAMTLPVGATLYLAPQFRLLPGLDLLSLLDEQAISVLTLPPSALAALPTEHNWSALETLIVAGEVCSAELAARWARRCRFFNAYGPTEATVCASMGAYADQQLQQQLNMGRPIANTQIYLLNEHLQAVPQGVKGEIYIAGVGLARGYLERAEVTAERFVPHPFSTISGARLYSTGDLARYRADGSLEFVGRVDQQVKVRGYRIELGEVETVLEQYPEVGESVVMVREDVSGDQRLVAYVVAQNGMSPLTNDLRQYLKERLPDYMLPSHFVVLEALPLLPTGKVDRRALPAPDTSQVEAGEEAAAAGSPIEDLLTMIWTEVLGRSMVSVHENFFESGGHSLLATQVISRVRTVMQVDLPVQRMFEAPTVAEFAQEIERSIRSEQGVEVPPLLPTSREQELPLSFAQQRLWFFDQLEPGSSAYNIPNTVRLSGQLDAAALERCLRELVRRHESLRTTFVSQAGRPVQVIGTAWRMELPVIDLQPLFQHKRLPEALRLAGEEALVPFDLSHGPLLRARLLRLGEDEHILLLSMHHIISDAWSMRVLVRELSTLYNAFVAGEILALPELPLQYADFAAWQRQWLQGEVLDAQMRYWTMQLNGLTPLELPTDHPRPAMQTFRGAHQSLLLPATLSTALKQLSQREGVTLFMTLLAAFQVLLSRYSGQSDIAVGTPIANRTLTELEDLIGFFVNTLVLRTDLSGNPSFLDLLKRVREVCLGAYAHQEVPFEKLVEVLQPERDLSRSPLFQAAFQLQHAPVARQALQGLTISSLPSQIRTAKFELTLAMTDSEPGLLCAVEYNADLFEASTISRLLGHWQTLLAGVVAHPEQHLAQLPLLSMAERQQLLADWNKTEVKYAEEECLHQLFEAQVVRTPEAAAVVCEDDYLTYGELNQRANQLAYYLRSLNIGPDVMVGICMERSLEMLVGILGTLKAGGAYVPLDPTHPQERLAFVLGDTQVSVLLTQETIVAKLPAHTAHVICLDADWELIAKESIFNPVSQNLLDDLAYVIYTSGSTGKPKGVLISHQNVVYSTRARFSYYSESVTSYLLLSPFTFDSSVAGIFWTLCQGGMLVLPEDNFQHDLSQLPTFIAQYGISHMLSIPSLYALVLSQAEQEQLCRLRTVIVAGEPCPVALVKRHSELLPHIALFNEYGPTEGAVWSSVYHCQIQEQRTQIPIGRPIANTQIYLLDANMQPVAVEMPGELYIGGIGLARGYLNQSQLTAEKFIPNTFRDKLGARLYRTGDLARYLSDGNIEFLGRVDQQVKLRGYRIELGEIEAVLGLHLEVRESVVIVREDVPGDQRLVAYVVMREEVNPSTVSLRQYLQERLPDYMVPSHFVILEALPLTPHGKVDRRALPVPEAGGVERSHDMDEARTPIEEIVAALWGEVLRLKQVGRDENFFELGGHSLLATQVISRVRSVLQVEVPLRSLFEAPTVAKLAERIERVMRSERGVEIPPLLPASREQELPLSFAQQRLWFLDQLEPGRAAYNIPNAVRLNGELDTAVLEKSIQEIVRRHESLRTTFYMREDQPVQVIAPVVTLRVTLAELSSLSPEKREVEAQRLVQQEAQQSFDLKRGPLLRTMLVRLGGEEHLLLLTMHHIISDGWSMDVLVRELSTLYKAFVLGKPSPLADLPVQYADFAAWQRRWLQGEVLDAQMRYWTERLSDIAPFELPTDHPRPAVHTFHGAAHRILLPASLSEALKRLSQREEVTLFMTLLAAFQALLVRYSGQSDIAVGIPIANRTHAELEDLIGFFVNTLVMRTDLSDNPSFREVLKRVREVCLGAYAHQEVPFEKLVEVLQPERDLSRSPLFQVAFGLQHAPRSPQRMQGLMVSGLAHESGTAKFDLSLAMTDSEQGLHCALEYNTDLFEASTISRFLEHFHTILVGIVAQPEQRLAELPLLSESERQQLLVDWNETQTEYPAGLCLHTLFEAQVERTPEAIALIFEDEHLSYRELNRRANQLAHHLQQLGVKPETFVGVCVERSPALLVSLLAILKVGGAYLPLDPTYPQERLAFLLADAQVSILLTQGHVRTGLPMHKASVICLDSDWQTLVQQCEENPHSPVHVENPAYVIYTSGTTGKPKGVVVTHQGIGNLAQAQGRTFAVRADSHVLQFASFSFDASISEMVMTLLAGATLYFAPQQQLLPGPDLMHLLQEQAITVLTLPPSALTALPVEQALPVLETLIVAGEACSADLVARWAQDRRFFNAYGPTEATVCASMGAYRAEQVKLSIGRPIDNTQVYLLDQYLQPVPRGVPGEIYISGVGLARGYLNRVEVTAECFVPHPFSTVSGARLYKTGDLARYLPGGDIEFLGRVDQQVKVRGYRIELGEIETVLGQHPAVKACAVVVREEVAGDKRLVVYVVARDEEASSGSELRQYLQERLPEYMLPSFFVMVEALPLLPNGKVDRRALPDPNSVAEERSEADVVARSPIEELLAMIWAEVLGRPMHSIYENFFEAGGHSLLATRLIARVRAVMQVELPLQSMFEAPTVAELAQEIEQVMRSEQGVEVPPPLAPVSREQQLPLSFAQQRLWFLDQLDPGNAAYNVPSAVRLSGRLNPQALEQSIQEIGRRHESLRTTFHTREDQPVQVIKANAQFCLSLADLSSLPSARSETEAQRLAQQEAHRPFDLAQGPLLRVRLLRLYEEEHVMLLTMHHIISDGWSMDVFVRELNILYRAFVAGQPSPLPELAIQYADFAAWQRRWLQGPVLDAQLAYWVRQLGGVTPLGLPTDYPRPAVQSYRGASYSFMLPVRLTEALKIVSRQEGVTLFMTLLAAFQTLLARHTGQSDIVVGTDIANRTHVETEALIGFFINLLVLRTDMSGTPTFRELLGRVREMVLTAYAHQDTPFEMLVERLQPEHSLDRMPLVQVLFVLQNIPLSHSDLSGVTLRPFGNGTNTAKFDLAVFLFEGTQGLHGGVTYSTDLFEARTIATMMSRFEVLLHTIAANPDTPIAALEIYTEAEKARQIERLGSTRRKLKTAKGKEIDLP
jgi:amino acid adenylation domain-containing protein